MCYPCPVKSVTLPKFNSSPLKSYRNPIGKDRLPTTIFQGRAVKLQGCILFMGWVGWSFYFTLPGYIKHVSNWYVVICLKSEDMFVDPVFKAYFWRPLDDLRVYWEFPVFINLEDWFGCFQKYGNPPPNHPILIGLEPLFSPSILGEPPPPPIFGNTHLNRAMINPELLTILEWCGLNDQLYIGWLGSQHVVDIVWLSWRYIKVVTTTWAFQLFYLLWKQWR